MKKAQNNTKPDKCILCGKNQSRFCNSHSVPRMVLQSISDNGKVLQANALIGLEVIDTEKGISNSGTFYFICSDCDNKYFQDYENPDNLQKKPTDKMMAEIALKNILIQLYKRKIEIELIHILHKEYGKYENIELLDHMKSLDIDEYTAEIDFYKKIINQDDPGCFQILFWRLLPYQAPIAAQSTLALINDRSGRAINNVLDSSKCTRIENLHLCVFPMEKVTSVLVFYHKRDRKYKNLWHQFNVTTDEENLKYVNWLIFKYTENYFFSNSIRSIIESEKKLQILSRDYIDYPNLGFFNLYDLILNNELVTMNDIPNFLHTKYSLK